MKKLFIVPFIIILLISISKNILADAEYSSQFFPAGDNYFNAENYNVEGSLASNLYKIRVQPNTKYTFLYHEGPSNDNDIYTHFAEEEITNYRVDIKTDSLDEHLVFESCMDYYAGSINYVEFTTGSNDQFIYNLSFPVYSLITNEYLSYFFYLYEGSGLNFSDMMGVYIDPIIKEQAFYEGVLLVDYDHPLTQEEINSHIRATDNIDGDITDEIDIIQNDYDPSNIRLGDYIISYFVDDSSHISTKYTLYVRVVDITPPTIFGAIEYEFGTSEKITTNEILKRFTVHDNIKKDVKLTIKSTDFEENKTGDFTIVLLATDNAGNEAEKEIKVKVYENIAPVITADEYIISKYTSDNLSLDDIKALFSNKLLIKKGVTPSNITILKDNYTGNEAINGQYSIDISYQANNTTFYDTIKISVLNKNISPTLDDKNNTNYTPIIISTAVLSAIIIGVSIKIIVNRKKHKINS